MTEDKWLVLFRGVPGCGKTTVAELWASSLGARVNSADNYFVDEEGNYNWDRRKIGAAHQWCKACAIEDMAAENPVVFVANTNTTKKELMPYYTMANKYGYKVISLIVENRHGGENVHGVPRETLVAMENRLRNHMQLLNEPKEG